MNPMLKVSAAVLLAAMSVVPVLAAVDTATMVKGTKADIVPAASLDKLIGTWSKAGLQALDGAKSIAVFDTKALYGAADVKLVGAADTKAAGQLAGLHAAINADSALKGWFDKNKIEVSRVIAITDTSGKLDVFLY